MNRMYSHMDEVDWLSKLADMKVDQYRNTLLLSALIEVLIDKKIMTEAEFTRKVKQLNTQAPDAQRPIS